MLTLPPSIRVYLARGATDMRRSIDGLSAATRNVLKEDPLSGHLFVFCNRGRDRIKVLYFERSGFWVLYKRLESGTFAWPAVSHDTSPHIEITSGELAAFLDGIDLRSAKRRRWFSHTA